MKFLTTPEVTLLATTCWVAEALPEDAAGWETNAPSVFSDFEECVSEKEGRIYFHTELSH
jgi:hypothetical protein